MKIALVNHNYCTQSDPNITYIPLGLAYIAAVLRKSGRHEVRIIDAAAYNLNDEQVERLLVKFGADIVGVGAATEVLESAIRVCKVAKKNSMISVIGGPHATISPLETLAFDEVDFVVIGEGEYTLLELADAIEQKKELKKVKGIMFKKKKGKKIEFVRTKPRELIKNLDDLPYPAIDMFPWKRYPAHTSFVRNLPCIQMITSRGCPFKCTFCGSSALWGGCRSRSAKSVVDEMEYLVKKFGFREIYIMDDTFNTDLKRAEEICDGIIKRKLNISIRIQARVYPMNRALLRKMKKAGIYCIYYGVESGNQEVLNDIKKGITLEQIKNAFKMTREAGIRTFAFFMIGLPKDTKKTIQDTFNLVMEIEPDFVNFTILVPYPGTQVYELAIREGSLERVKPKEIFRVPLYKNKNLDEAYLRKKMFTIYKKFYMRPSYLLKRLVRLRTFTELKTNIISGLPFFQRKNPFNVKGRWIIPEDKKKQN